jgi:predicted enzyme related to lactoylglutathione lyase
MPLIDAPLVNRPCWFDLSTSDLTAAKAQYGELFGWSYMDGGPALGHYTMAFNPAGRGSAGRRTRRVNDGAAHAHPR